MSAFLKIDRCSGCQRDLPWEWVPPVELAGRTLAGTGVWGSGLIDGYCAGCIEARSQADTRGNRVKALREGFIQIVGGQRPYREFTFSRYQVSSGSRTAFESACLFEPGKHNLYLWGASGVGKTHIAVSILRRWFAKGASVALITPAQLVRRLRMKSPEEEQQTIDRFARVDVFVLDHFGLGSDTFYTGQVLQEILDSRDFNERRGLVVTSQYSLDNLARRLIDRSVISRLMGMCRVTSRLASIM